ncbi:hypothetical protein [Leptolyngbya sp. CCY15150]|uniref:hypothetical protein n=1 Tax=Leptolyngbya sp. CCY15150 TaxID=2767772 RepID=UPI001951E0AE|nr:hypothetical protein [Leptolyngbya sp. CCY15150]
MAKDTSKFTIRVDQLAEALEISLDRLVEIIDFFDSDPDDEWQLKENDHFIFLNKKQNERIFSQIGAFAIAKYMDSQDTPSIWERIREFLTRHKEKLRQAFINRKIHENCSSLTVRNNRHFLSKKDVVNILCTSYPRINQAFDAIRRSDRPLIIGEDFDDIDGVRYYSLNGFSRLSRELATTLTMKDRREWCDAVEVVGKKTLRRIVDELEGRKQAIQRVKDRAKTRDKSTCQITGRKHTPHKKVRLAAHHMFSESHYPHLATSIDNLITMDEDIHQEFHSWMGNTKVACTIDHLITFVCERYPECDEAIDKLYAAKKILGHQTPKGSEGQAQLKGKADDQAA